MQDLKFPVILLILLIACLFFYYNYIFQTTERHKIISNSKINKVSPNIYSDKKLDDILEEVNKLISESQFQEALNKLLNLQNSNSTDHRVLASLGYCYAGIKDFSKAIEYFEKAYHINYHVEYGYSIAYLSEWILDYKKAYEYYSKLENKNEDKEFNIKVQLGKARCLYNLQFYTKAYEVFWEVSKKSGTEKLQEPFIYMLKTLLFSNNFENLSQLNAFGDRVLSNSYLYNFYAGLVNYYAKNNDQALNYFRKALSINPNNTTPCFYIYRLLKEKNLSEALEELYKFYTKNTFTPYVLFNAALEAHKLGKYDYAYKFYRSAVSLERELLSRDDNGLLKDAEKHYINKINDEIEKQLFAGFLDFVYGDIKSSHLKLSRIKNKIKDGRLKEDFDRIYNFLEGELYKQNRYKEYQEKVKREQQLAIADLKKKLYAAKPSSTNSAKNNLEDKINDLKMKALNQPNDLKLQYKTALELAKLGDIEGAKLFLRETLRINSNVIEAYYSLAKLNLLTENLFEAELNVEEALKKAPNHTQTLSLASIIYYKKGDYETAKKKAEEALFANPNNYEARLVLANILSDRDPSQAMMHINYLETQNLDSPEIKKELEIIKKKLFSSN